MNNKFGILLLVCVLLINITFVPSISAEEEIPKPIIGPEIIIIK